MCFCITFKKGPVWRSGQTHSASPQLFPPFIFSRHFGSVQTLPSYISKLSPYCGIGLKFLEPSRFHFVRRIMRIKYRPQSTFTKSPAEARVCISRPRWLIGLDLLPDLSLWIEPKVHWAWPCLVIDSCVASSPVLSWKHFWQAILTWIPISVFSRKLQLKTER